MSLSVTRLLAAVTAIAGILVFFGFPDWDIRILGIGAHRNFLFHSAGIVLVFYLFLRKRNFQKIRWLVLGSFVTGCGLAVGIHLFVDLFQSKAVLFPIVKSLVDGTSIDDRLWLAANAIGCFVLCLLSFRKCADALSRCKYSSSE